VEEISSSGGAVKVLPGNVIKILSSKFIVYIIRDCISNWLICSNCISWLLRIDELYESSEIIL